MLDVVKTFVRDEIIGREAEFDVRAEMPLPIYGRMHDLGLTNWWLTGKDGEPGRGLAESVDIVSELAYGDAGIAFTSFISVLGTSIVQLYGSPELQERWLPPMAADGTFCATLGSEHDAGSELARISTTATPVGDEIELSGVKSFSTNSGFADFLVVVARNGAQPAAQLAVLVPRDTPGVSIERRWEMNGLHASGTYRVGFEAARVPAGHLLAGPGLRLLEIGLNASRILIAATAVGIARRIRDLCMDYARSKPLKGSTLLNNAVFAAKLGQMEMQIAVMRNQCLAAAAEYDALMASPDPAAAFTRLGTMKSALASKMYCGQAGWQIADVGSQMFGGLGYTDDLPIGKLVRDMRYVSIVEGGDDVLRDTMFARYVVPTARRV